MPKTTKTTVANRLSIILTRLNNHEKLSIPLLAEEFEVDVRTIQKDINERFAFLPIEKVDGLYRLKEHALGKMSFKDIQNFASVSGIAELYPALNQKFITELLSDRFAQTCLVKPISNEEPREYKELFYKLNEAIYSRYKVKFFYSNKPRVVSGYKLFNNDGIWYLIADDGGKLKHFSLAKIEDWIVSNEVFIPNEIFVKTIEENNLEWFSSKPIEVILKIDSQVSSYFLDRKILANQTIINNDSKKLTLSTKVAYEQEIFRVVRAWIPHIKIVEPRDWQESLEDTLREYLNK